MGMTSKAPLLWGAGLLSAGLLGLTGTGTLSSISAQILTQPNTVSLGRMILELSATSVNEKGENQTSTCRSTDSTTNVFTCATIQPLSGRSDLLPGQSAVTTVTATNRGSVMPSSFTLTSGACGPTGAPADDDSKKALEQVCDRISIQVAAGEKSVFTGTARELSSASVALPVPAKGAQIPVTLTVTPDKELANAYQGLGISMPMTWTFQQ